MDKICMKNMEFYGYHGVLESEKKYGQKFYVDIEILLDLSLAGRTDNLTDTVDYSVLFGIAKELTENGRFDLIEALASKMAEAVIVHFENKITEVTVRIRKPSAPIAGIFDYAEVEVKRRR